jgi:carbonic anhydrase
MDLTREDEESIWNPLQFHFHAPSEHTIMGKNMDLEMHIVHLTPEGELAAVLGIMFDVEEGGDNENSFLA